LSARRPAAKPETRFLVRFVVFLAVFYLAVAVQPMNDHVVVPFTAKIVTVSTASLKALGEPASAVGTQILSPGFAVDVKNGCNGVEAMLILVAAVLAFPASWRQRLAGLAVGVAVIQALNLVRVVSLFWLGVHRRDIFETFHTAVWQTILILVAVGIFLLWSRRVGSRAARA
jgi:exosortase H (IPTLxxWG-CTERM-specific)